MSGAVKEITQTAQKTAATFREAIQDMLVPEIRSMKVAIEALTSELRLRDANQTANLNSLRETQTANLNALRDELRLRDTTQTANLDSLREELRLRDATQTKNLEALREEVRLRSDSLKEEMRSGFKRIDDTLGTYIEVRERLAGIEARLPRVA